MLLDYHISFSAVSKVCVEIFWQDLVWQQFNLSTCEIPVRELIPSFPFFLFGTLSSTSFRLESRF